MRTLIVGLFVLSLLVVGCGDKAKEAYASCLQADAAGDVIRAWNDCTEAVRADPNSTSGKAAATKLAELKPKYDDAKHEQKMKEIQDGIAARASADAKAKAEESAKAAQAIADASARAAQVEKLRDKVTKKFWDADKDADCTGKGLPPYRWNYEGGTYAEDEIVALADGCQHLFQNHGSPSPNDATFCCPKRPSTW